MSTIAQDIYTTLAGYTGLSALVGAKVYPSIVPDGANASYVVWDEIATVPVNGLDGHHGLNNYHVQVVSIAVTGEAARAVAAQVRNAMRAATLFKALEVDYGTVDFEVGSKLYGMRSDFSLWSEN